MTITRKFNLLWKKHENLADKREPYGSDNGIVDWCWWVTYETVYPLGGDFSWDAYEIGSGEVYLYPSYIESDTIYMDLKAPSDEEFGDIELELIYTFDGVWSADSVLISIRTPKTTEAIAGSMIYYLGNYKRRYYHVLYDQFGALIDEVGIPCSETGNINKLYGEDPDITGDGETTTYPNSDGDWVGGFSAARKDLCLWPGNAETSCIEQTISVGTYETSPTFYIYFDPGNEDYEIMKNTTRPPGY